MFHHPNPSHPTAVVGEIKLLFFNNSRVFFKVCGVLWVIIETLENANFHKSADFFKGFTRVMSKFGVARVVMQSLENANFNQIY